MKKRICVVLSLFLLFLTACGNTGNDKEGKTDGFYLYYLNKESNAILMVEHELNAESTEDRVRECMSNLRLSPDDKKYNAPFSSGRGGHEYKLENNQVNVYFNDKYNDLSTSEEVLTRAAIVRTLVQVPGVECVSFYVDGAPLKDAKGNVVGIMTADSFVENAGKQINTVETQTITLYYASKAGDGLVAQEYNVHTSTNVSMEKLVLEHLMQAPTDSSLRRTIPVGTKLISVSTLDGICFVNFDEGFLAYDYAVNEDVALYSIVNSLCEINGVSKVQISVNGETNIMFREKYSLDDLYERDLDCVLKKGN